MNNITNADPSGRVLCRGVLSERSASKEKEPSQEHSSRDKEPSEETTMCWNNAYPTYTCNDGRARPPAWYGDVPPPWGPAPSAPSVAHATTTKQDPGRRRHPDSTPSCVSRKVAPPNASPAEPRPGHRPYGPTETSSLTTKTKKYNCQMLSKNLHRYEQI